MPAVRISRSALADLEAIQDWYLQQGIAEIGLRLSRDILERIQLLETHPELGRIVPEFSSPSLRELIHPPFRIVYRHEHDRVQVIRVWRSERLLQLPDDSP